MIEPMKFQSILDAQQRKWERIADNVKRLPDDPMLLVTEIFSGGDLFLAERLKQEGEHVLLDAQSYWMALLLPVLSEYFGTAEISIQYDSTVALAPLLFVKDEQVIAVCSPYWRTFEEIGVPGKEELLQNRLQLQSRISEHEEMLERWMNCEENPSLLGEDDTWLFAKATLNPKKYKKLAREKAMEVQAELLLLRQQVDSVDFQLERAEQAYLETSYYLERIKKRVEKWGDFTFYAPVSEGE